MQMHANDFITFVIANGFQSYRIVSNSYLFRDGPFTKSIIA